MTEQAPERDLVTESPQPYTPGTILDLRMLNSVDSVPIAGNIQAKVLDAFLPFTKSQVLRVELATEAETQASIDVSASSTLPTTAIVKLYDRRYIDDRKDQPWSPSVEAAARKAWKDGRFKHILDPFKHYHIDWDFDESDIVHCEAYYRYLAHSSFTSEREVYRRLSPLQGKFIPRCYAAVQLQPLEEDRDVPKANIFGLILEDVTGEDLSTFDADSHDIVSSGHALLAAVSTFPSYGVLHRDIRSPNIIARPSPNLQMNQLVLIDFGNAWFRGGPICRTNERFERAVEDEDEVGALRYILDLRRVRPASPFNTNGWAQSGRHRNNNGRMKKYRTTDVKRWFDELPRERDDPELGRFESDREIWRTKPEVLEWLASRANGSEGLYVQRPGSPLEHVVTPEWRVEPYPSESSSRGDSDDHSPERSPC